MAYEILAYYFFTALEEPHLEVKNHKNFFSKRDVTGRIYISEEGINGQMSGAKSDIEAYIQWMKQDKRFEKMPFKIHTSSENVFPRMTVKYREQLVALDKSVDMSLGGEHVSPLRWKEMIENKEDNCLLIDVRNDYETAIGHFEDSELPQLGTFREFPKYVEDLKERVDPKNTKIMMCCTGGIRCEVYSALMKEEGFDTVYQLDGGIINYGLQEGNDHWKGKLFVFDDRLAIPISSDEHSVIAKCSFCDVEEDHYYNCANVDCNELFLACLTCFEKHKGCCQSTCIEAPRVRPVTKEDTKRPYRRLHESCPQLHK
jgi:UPF0176 protein